MVSTQYKSRGIDQALADLEVCYHAANPKSRGCRDLARRVLPGGNTRAVLHYDPFPLFIDNASGSHVRDVDGHDYIDFTNDMTAGFYGHSNPIIFAAIRKALDNGISFGGPHSHEVALAETLCGRFSSIERVRFCNSGTEANLVTMSLARALTGRPLILAFKGGYHGSLMSYTNINAGLNIDINNMRFADFNDADDARRALVTDKDRIAAIIVEPMMGSGGGILAERSFLFALRELADEFGALLIFDEVVTARFSPGGLQDVFKVRPDLTSLGKSLGGGLTFGAFGGRADLIDRMDPSSQNALMHSGTFNNNVLTMIAGYTGLTKVATAEVLMEVNDRGDCLRSKLLEISTSRGVAFTVTGYGSVLSLHFQAKAPVDPSSVTTTAAQRKLFHLDMLLRGFYVPRRGTINLSLATSDEECEAFVHAFAGFLDDHHHQLPAIL
ncbi:MAG: aminotransferase class III-fold pyridoxal phosphate-dependent enzyme [Mesorhizobium sp.]|nr:MAG: aminotransferase class III-fold pyridoxal phosphate-dependent enzyme [Mesorhizobium sp.]